MIGAWWSPDELGPRGHGVNDEVDSDRGAHADLEELTGPTRSDEHDEVVELQDSHGVVVGVEDVVIVYAVLSCAGDDHRIHGVNLS